MPFIHTVPKVMVSLAMVSGPIMIAAAFGHMECPSQLIKAGGVPTGTDKASWGASFFGTSRENILLFCGLCKVLAALDIWVLHVMPRLALLCFAGMMGFIVYAHNEIGDDLVGPVVMCVMALATLVTWPSSPAARKKHTN